MNIKNLRKVENCGKLKAFFSVEWDGKMTVNDCKLVEGKNGLFAAMPSKEYLDKKTNQKKYESIVYAEQDLLNKISRMAQAEYERLSGKREPAQEEDVPF